MTYSSETKIEIVIAICKFALMFIGLLCMVEGFAVAAIIDVFARRLIGYSQHISVVVLLVLGSLLTIPGFWLAAQVLKITFSGKRPWWQRVGVTTTYIASSIGLSWFAWRLH